MSRCIELTRKDSCEFKSTYSEAEVKGGIPILVSGN